MLLIPRPSPPFTFLPFPAWWSHEPFAVEALALESPEGLLHRLPAGQIRALVGRAGESTLRRAAQLLPAGNCNACIRAETRHGRLVSAGSQLLGPVPPLGAIGQICLLYKSDAADDLLCV